jgi:hypothetical protein
MIRELENFECCCGAVITAATVAGGVAPNGTGYKLSKPSRKQILAAVRETFDKIWYARHLQLGRPSVGEESAVEIERIYGKSALDICDTCLLRLEGTLAGLRWAAHGAPIDNYDT